MFYKGVILQITKSFKTNFSYVTPILFNLQLLVNLKII